MINMRTQLVFQNGCQKPEKVQPHELRKILRELDLALLYAQI